MGEAKRRQDLGLPIRALQPGQQIQIDISNATQKLCECGNKYFQAVMEFYIVSALVSPLGMDTLAQKPVFICTECKKPIKIEGLGEAKSDNGGENGKSTQ